jgi:hypothetical protein
MSTELDEALTAAGVPQLVQKTIDPLLLEYQRRYSPMIRSIPTKSISSTTYYFNRRTNRAPGGFVTDGGARPMGASVYEQFQFTIKLLQAVGGVTGFAQEVTRDQIGDLRAQEIASCMQGLLWDIEHALFWGSAEATQYGPWPQFDGLDVMISQWATTPAAPQNSIDVAGAAFALRHLDLLIDMLQNNAAAPILGTQWAFVGSPTALNKISQYETPLQRFLGETQVAAGLTVQSYRDIPLIPSSFLGSRLAGSMPTVTGAPATTGGSLAAGSYYYQVEPVMSRAGCGTPSAEVQVTTTGTTGTATLSFTPPVGPEGSGPQSYRVYRGGAAGAETLLGIVDAVVGTQADGITPIYASQIIDTGSALVPAANGGATQPLRPLTSYVGGGPVKPRVAGGEDIWLIPRDPDLLLRPYVRDIRPLAIYPTTASPDQLPFALATDTCLAVRGPKFIGRARNVLCQL